MREYIYFSSSAVTTGNFDTTNLMKAGRMDIACHVVVSSFFLSHALRDDVKLHLVFYGPPNPPRHITMHPKTVKGIPETGSEVGSVDISKKDIAGLIKKILYKYKEGRNNEAFQGFFIEKKSLLKVVEELIDEGKTVYVLDKKGESIRKAEIGENPVFILGDHNGLPSKELKRLKKLVNSISIGKKMYFASQVVSIVNHELDFRELQP